MMAEKFIPVTYAITPETPFSPSVSKVTSSSVYKVGTVLNETESRHVEYKSGGGNYPTLILPSHIRKYGSAFLNASGGILYVGVSDEGIIHGIRLATYYQKEAIQKYIQDEFRRFTPSVKEDLYEIKFIPTNRRDHYILKIMVRAGIPDEIYSDGEDKMYYKRDGSVEGPLWPSKIIEIVTAKFYKMFESQAIDALPSDIYKLKEDRESGRK